MGDMGTRIREQAGHVTALLVEFKHGADNDYETGANMKMATASLAHNTALTSGTRHALGHASRRSRRREDDHHLVTEARFKRADDTPPSTIFRVFSRYASFFRSLNSNVSRAFKQHRSVDEHFAQRSQ